MSNRRRGFGFWLRAWWPVAAGVAIIVLESTVFFSAIRTSGPLRMLYQALFGTVDNVEWATIHFYIRKSGHFLGYGLLSLAWLRAWWLTLPNAQLAIDAVLALLGTAMTASADELHQSLLPGRTGTPWDILLDCSGAITILVIALTCIRIFRPKRLARAA
jgi:VanZ family protein